MPHVHVVGCGGTIASEPDTDGAAPKKPGAALLDAVPRLAEYAEYTVTDVASRPGFDMDFETVAAVAREARDAVDAGADGVVVTHGTDTLADTAYALDLTLSPAVPVVVTGAQRRLDEPSSDAPANLLTAVRAATTPAFAGGVTVAFDDELHAARDVVKAHTNALDTFRSPGAGPVATFSRGGVTVHRDAASRSVSLPRVDAAASVPVVHSGIGIDGGQLTRAVDAGADGVVVEGTGLGNVTGSLGDAVAAAVDAGVPVVVASRCHAGPTDPVYGTAGGGVTLVDHGAMLAGDLPASKARIKLAFALGAGRDGASLASLF